MGDSSPDAAASMSETAAEEVSLFSMTDMVLFSLIIGLLTYWFLFRKKKEDIPEFTKIQPAAQSSVKDSSFVEKMKKTVSFPPVLSPAGLALAVGSLWGAACLRAAAGILLHTHSHLNSAPRLLRGQPAAHRGASDIAPGLTASPTSSIRQYELAVHTDVDTAKVYTGEMGRLKSYENQKPPYDAKNPFLAAVTTNRKLNQGSERHLMHLELDISDSKIRYESGDHVAVYPANDSTLVNQIGEILGADLDIVMSLNNLDEESNKKHPFPCPTSYRTALTYYLDITNPPRTNVLYELAQYAAQPAEQEQLRKMASSSGEGKELYLSWVVEARRHILAILQDYPSLRPPIDHLCELLPRLQARYYSIASSSKVHPSSVHICAVAVEYETKAGRLNKGVATSWLRTKEPAGENGCRALVPMFVRKSQFRLPFKATTPVIMVGPGTGVAPFIGFIQERAWLQQQGKEVGETLLYYGCRRSDEDYLYREELERFHQEGALTQLNVAFSREQPQKVYVQHLLKRDKEHLWKLIHDQGAHIYVCGDARNMAKDVQNAFYNIVEELGTMEHAQAVDYVKKLMTKGRYSLDVWS
ncbi:NADPH--cytochrome P450 reductase [Erinaceus europaeus]|uniref:NADPH--hemoprotein reductase n=1 Tax=Erinaceus europaeus TaxID=9365 RepID=A0ABM3VVF0_ERIEU|nr:NADPH--cytochrome P450 reductase [Erinaceus europaeus]